MDNVGSKIRKLFDYQRFEKEPKLQRVIDSSTGKRKMSDDELEFVAGGVMTGDDPEDPQANGRCPTCGGYLKKDQFGIFCPTCNPRQLGLSQKTPVQASTSGIFGKNNS